VVGSGSRGAQGSDRKGKRAGRRARGVWPTERDGFWHAHGSVRVGGRAVRIRRSLGLPVDRLDFDTALAECRRIERETIGAATGEFRPGDYLAAAAKRYLSRPRRRPLGTSSIVIVGEIAAKFGLRRLNQIEPEEWHDFVDRRHAGNRPETRERYLNSLLGFLAFCRRDKRSGLDEAHMPAFERDREARSPAKRQRRRVVDLRRDLIVRLLSAMHIALRAQLAVEWSTGARVGSVLHGCSLADLILAPGREQITFHDTKNGESVTAALHPSVVPILEEYLAWRGRLNDRTGPLFLTPRKLAYSDRAGGTQNKTAFNAGKRRAIQALREEAAAEARRLRRAGKSGEGRELVARAGADAGLLALVTQHWFRHLLATEMAATDIRAGMEQGGWKTVSAFLGYAHDVPEHRRKAVAARVDLDTSLTRGQGTANRKA